MRKLFLLISAVCTCLSSCQQEPAPHSGTEGTTLRARIENEEESKTYLDGANIRWAEHDQIIAFMKGSYGHKYEIVPSYAGKVFADFTKVPNPKNSNYLSAGIEYDHIIAYYPYSESIQCEKNASDYTLNIELPSEQHYAMDSFANNTFPMVAVSEDTDITFRNICGGIKLQLKGTQMISKIEIRGNKDEKISGAATVTSYPDNSAPHIEMEAAASSSVTLNCNEGVQLDENSATNFIIVLPPVEFTEGFTITVTDDDGFEYEIKSTKHNEVMRSGILSMPEIVMPADPTNSLARVVVENNIDTKSSSANPFEVSFDQNMAGETVFVNGKLRKLKYDGQLYVMADESDTYTIGYPADYFTLSDAEYLFNAPTIQFNSSYIPYCGVCSQYETCKMDPIVAVIKVNLSSYPNVSYLDFTAIGNENITGQMSRFTTDYPYFINGTNSFRVHNVSAESTYFWIPPTTLESGFTIVLYDSEGTEIISRSMQRSVTFRAKYLSNLGTL